MKFNYEPPEKELLSDFNEAKFQIYRLHESWTKCNSYSTSGKLTQWKWELDVVYRELSKDADGIKRRDYLKDIEEINKEIIRAEILARKNNNPEHIYQALSKKEIILRALQDDSGKGSKRSDPDERLMD